MDFFKFNPSTDPTVLLNGELINNIDRSMWIERYAAPGEFSFEAKLSSGLRQFLPEGTIVSHADTLELMIVENQEIPENKEEDPTVVITGRSFVSYLENRIVGANQARASSTVSTYDLASNYPCDQIVAMINDHILSPYSTDDSLVHVQALSAITSDFGIAVARTVEFGPLLDRVLELLTIDDLGIKTVRANPFGVLGGPTETVIYVYRGFNRSANVIFSWDSGDIDAAQYLFSNKDNKTSAFVKGQYVCVMVDGSETKYNRRIMMVDGTDIDGNLGEMPTGGTLTAIIDAMTVLGRLALANQNNVDILQSDMSKTSRYQYRKDFNVGDLVTVNGNFGQVGIFRVVEYAEIEDENGESGHPTLVPQVGIISEEPPPNEGPVAVLTVTPTTGAVSLLVHANASGSTDDEGVVLYEFDFGDGSSLVSGTSPTADHTYTSTGTFTVTCTVEDSEGLISITTRTVTVTVPPPPPTYTIGSAIVPRTIV